MEIKIYYEDTDCGGVVYYANYFKYFERARTDYLERCGLTVTRLRDQGVMFLVTHAEAHYRAPARYGDTLSIDTTLSLESRASLTFHHRILENATRRLIVEGSATLVPVNGEGRVIRLDPVIAQTLKA